MDSHFGLWAIIHLSTRPVGTYQLKYSSQFLADFWAAANPRILIAIHSLSTSAGPMAWSCPMAGPTSPLRQIRTRLGLSQAECATTLGVALETFRTWDAGRRPAPEAVVQRARTLKAKRPLHDLVPLQVLADELHVHVRTLRAAAHDGRLAVTFGPRPFVGKLTAAATREAGARFMSTWYRRTYGRGRRGLVPVFRVSVPANYAAILVGLRHRIGLSQQQLAAKVGAATTR